MRRSALWRWWYTIRRRPKWCIVTRPARAWWKSRTLFVPPELPPAADVLAFRERLGVPADAFLFGVFGFLRETDGLLQVLDAFAAVAREMPQAILLVAGDFVSTDLERSAAHLLLAPRVRRLPFLPDADFWLAASAVDACINLRYPAAGETSGIAIRLMGIGKPVIVTESAEYEALSRRRRIRVTPGLGERQSLCEHIVLLTSMSDVARAIGRRGAGHIRTRHGVDVAGSLYWDVLCECCASSPPAPPPSAPKRDSSL